VEFGFVFTLKTNQLLQLNLFERRDCLPAATGTSISKKDTIYLEDLKHDFEKS